MANKTDVEALYQEAVNGFSKDDVGVLLLILAELREINSKLPCQK
jgi:hypothetical protein